MLKRIFAVMCVMLISIGCASVQVKAPKEPIKVDISMRVDVYQHVEKDIDAIENMVSGGGTVGPQSFLPRFVNDAYADDGFGPDVDEAATRRKDRRSQVVGLLSSGAIGENSRGMLEVRNSDSAAAEIVSAENSDRSIIYRAIANKNGTSVADVEKLYAKRLQSDAPSGAPIETPGGWQTK
jgi:uncharacterized protein YdbL (DUF1318 family)